MVIERKKTHWKQRAPRALWAAVLVACTMSLLGCSSSTAPLASEGVIARSSHAKVAVTNTRANPVFVFVIGRNASAVVDWRPCVTGAECVPLAAGGTREYEINPITSSYHEAEALVYWWQAVTRDGTLQPDSIRHMVVPLK